MSYVLYGDRRSGSAIVELALAEIDVPVTVREVRIGAGEQRGDAYGAVNPQHKLPALRTPDGETLTESAAIVLTLAERHPEASLLPPPGSPERAQVIRWLLFLAAECYPLVEMGDYPERFVAKPAEAGFVQRVDALWKARWSLVEAVIAGTPWLAPTGFSVADAYLAVMSRWMPAEWRAAHLPRVDAIAAAIAHRPRLDAVWQRHFGQGIRAHARNAMRPRRRASETR